MKKIACIVFLALAFTNCKKNNSDEELKPIEKQTTASSVLKKEKKVADDCMDIEVEMGTGRECILQNTDLDLAYKNIIKNKEVEETEYYLSSIPSKNTSVEVNKNGLLSIDYKITKDKVAITMNYQGGVTEVTLEKLENTIKKSIYHYAD